MLKPGEIVEFDRKKQFKYVKPLGAGGTGDTHLFEDETTGILFAFKKYVPKDLDYIDDHYSRFVDEIKILFHISHPNIVRIYNYYLYPEFKIGYLQMEYVDGCSIGDYEPDGWSKNWDDVFVDVISAFVYLESNGILHRDIRPANILIDKNENIKIIDFGFGKRLKSTEKGGKSVLLNWPVTVLPEETVIDGVYNHQTEVYFVGKLFQQLIGKKIEEFKFNSIINKMTEINTRDRYKSFDEVSKAISIGIFSEVDFSENERFVYLDFADKLTDHINHFKDKYSPINDLGTTINLLASLIRDSSLEKYIQANNRLINCFVNGGFVFSSKPDIEVECLKSFYLFLTRLPLQKQKIVIDNIYTRLSRIRIIVDDDLPF